MDVVVTLLVVVGVIVLLWIAWTFNGLVRRRNGVDEAWSTIGVELTRRYDLVPRLVDAVRGYADFEESLLTRVTDARARAVSAGSEASADEAAAETGLSDAIRSLFAVAEAYPDLKATENFQSLQDELALTEDRIAYARAVYNAWVTNYETVRQTLPSALVAYLFRFVRREYFEADIGSRAAVAVDLRTP
ncbi:MAG: LemA family protein [Chloroflexi bacterium]|nr:LemA family protein [Chloroflexota bacterium]